MNKSSFFLAATFLSSVHLAFAQSSPNSPATAMSLGTPDTSSQSSPQASPFAASGTSGDVAAHPGEWTHYGNSAYGTRYSPLSDITPQNVGRLTQAWVYHSGMKPAGASMNGGLEVTPLMVDNKLYGCTAYNTIFALDPNTGKEVWKYDPKVDSRGVSHPVCRGVAFYRVPANISVPDCQTRILTATIDNRLIAIDAKTGEKCRSFGKNGEVNLLDHMGDFPRGWSYPTSPPTIVRDTAVVGALVIDNQSTKVPPGVVRGFDVVTGAFKWAFDVAHPDDHSEPGPGKTYTPSTPNSWTVASADDGLGLVYVPMGNGSPDYFGGNRTLETDKYSSSVVALDAETGAVRWHFQAIHHDLWDYDLAAQPVLTDISTESGTIPGLLLPTKTGQIFVLDRRTGKPLSKIAEKPVPLSEIAGEKSSPTQPFSIDMPSFAGPDLSEADMWGVTPFDQLYCRIKYKLAEYKGIFTPLRTGPSVRTPGELGGIDWGSVSVDEDHGIMIVNSNLMADYDELISRQEADKEHLYPAANPLGENAPGAAMAGTPYGVHWGAFLTPLHIPCQKPPYGFLSAVDLKTHKLLWKKRLGNAANSGPWGIASHIPLPLGTPNIGGSIVTKGGLIFIAATQDQYFRAVDIKTGKTLWSEQLPAGGHSTPITYKTDDGSQFVLIAAGGNLSMQTTVGDELIAFKVKE
ncbi:glucose dehydrogenase [Ameyamaea chiangmaiensis NBRC 103196]|uniref:Pyrroloquinoline quinone-dependent dehydrogenase n=1 Tax=Ameyamaea chiangmaiensis TaxID=442969 RepID=A0A850P8Q7_9PROT|nr:pyrroloquinoline quinone-dependent dehydrogenase [Ameyamaea chiangmaiensis]MBS4075583.1 pyrroloquinoline quinone-dependent dehydrogenase [Ameyamaea chiangmaiensis]NVN40288.1 pyrroloquinoline quinone-dependent dehydrogenase [Ameyamaea chiangmaiensis]GBQ70871.1 glucose dehydrogenase [Ameyamaea chiangmaiensis NBRC 103196]